MSLGVAYIVFDGEELLVHSVRRMRAVADKIVLVFSERSNSGETNPQLGSALESLNGIVDLFIPFTPKPGIHPHYNEITMRNAGAKACADCDVFMSMDSDEFYDPVQIETALNRFIVGGANSSACSMQHYYKYADVRLVPAPALFVSLFYRNDGRLFLLNHDWPVLVDPTRRMPPGDSLIFDRKTIEMHHLCHVRRDIRQKFRNSSAIAVYAERMETMALEHDAWAAGQPALGHTTEIVPLRFPELGEFASKMAALV